MPAAAELLGDGLQRENSDVVVGDNGNNGGSLVAVALETEREPSPAMVVRHPAVTAGGAPQTVSDGYETTENGGVVSRIEISRMDGLSNTNSGHHSRAIADNRTDVDLNCASLSTAHTTIIDKEIITTKVSGGRGTIATPQPPPSQAKTALHAPRNPFRTTRHSSPALIYPGREAKFSNMPSVVSKKKSQEQSPRNVGTDDLGNDQLTSRPNDLNGTGNNTWLRPRENDPKNASWNAAAAEAPPGKGTASLENRFAVPAHNSGHLSNAYAVGTNSGIDNTTITSHHNAIVSKETGHADDYVDDASDVYATDEYENGSSESRFQTTGVNRNHILPVKEEEGLRGDGPSPHVKADNAHRNFDDTSKGHNDTLAQRNENLPQNVAAEDGGAPTKKPGSPETAEYPMLATVNALYTGILPIQEEAIGFTINGKCETAREGRSQGGSAPQSHAIIEGRSSVRDRARLLECAPVVRTNNSSVLRDFVRGVLEQGVTLTAAAIRTGTVIEPVANEMRYLRASPEVVPPERTEYVCPQQRPQHLRRERSFESDREDFRDRDPHTHEDTPPVICADFKGNWKCEIRGESRSRGGAAPPTMESNSSVRDKAGLLESTFRVRPHRGSKCSAQGCCFSRAVVCGVLEEGENLAAAAATATALAIDSVSRETKGDSANPELPPPTRNNDTCPQQRCLRDGSYVENKHVFDAHLKGFQEEDNHIQKKEARPATPAYRNNSRSGGNDDNDERPAEPLGREQHLADKAYSQTADGDNRSCGRMIHSMIGACEDATTGEAAAVDSCGGREGDTAGGYVAGREVWGCALEHPARAFRLLWQRNR